MLYFTFFYLVHIIVLIHVNIYIIKISSPKVALPTTFKTAINKFSCYVILLKYHIFFIASFLLHCRTKLEGYKIIQKVKAPLFSQNKLLLHFIYLFYISRQTTNKISYYEIKRHKTPH